MIAFLTNVASQLTAKALIAVALATAGAIVIGMAYHAILGKAWRRAASLMLEAARPSRPIGTYLITGVCYALVALALFGVTWHASGATISVRASLIAAGLVWIGFVVGTTMANHRYEGRPVSLTLIVAGHWFLVMFVQGVVIGLVA